MRGKCNELPVDLISLQMRGRGKGHTKREPMILFSNGSDARPVSAGSVFMM